MYVRNEIHLGFKVLFACAVLVGVILFSVSFDTLAPTQVGLVYNSNLVEVSRGRVYNNGRYFLGVGLSFIKFPMDMRLVEFTAAKGNAVAAWSKEGQALSIEFSFYYRLERDKIVDLYARYGKDYADRYEQIALAVIKGSSVQYTADQFFSDRLLINTNVTDRLRLRLREEFATVELVNMRQITVPARFDAKILDKVVTVQQQLTAENEKNISIGRAEIDVIRGEGAAQVNLTLSRANADRSLLVAQAEANGLAALRLQESMSYQMLQAALGMNATELLQYRWAQLANRLESSNQDDQSKQTLQYVVGFDAPLITVKT